MSIFGEYALVPDIFDATSYSSPQVCPVHLQQLKEVLLEEGIVRDLRDGGWTNYVKENFERWDNKAKELLKKLATQGRMRRCPPVRLETPETDLHWCQEALETHQRDPLLGIITGRATANEFRKHPEICSIERLSSAQWWSERAPSLRLRKKTDDYLKCLNPILKHANSIMFIDPHLDPGRSQYNEFNQLIQSAKRDSIQPHIEIHRVCYEGSGPSRIIFDEKDLKPSFKTAFDPICAATGIRISVFVWSDFHDRYLISDIGGINLPYGFDIDRNEVMTTWSRLSRKDRDDVQREFDPASKVQNLLFKFQLGEPE